MDGETLVDRLVEHRLLEENPSGYVLSDEFSESVSDFEGAICSEESTRRELYQEHSSDTVSPELLERIFTVDERLLAQFIALRDRITDLTAEQAVKLLFVVTQFDKGMPRSEGTPESFLPIHGELFQLAIDIYSPAVVYIWRDECPSCDEVKTKLDTIFSAPTDDIGRISVYGPDIARLLDREYNVVGAPTILFIIDGSVDARLQGYQEEEVIRREVETIRDPTGG